MEGFKPLKINEEQKNQLKTMLENQSSRNMINKKLKEFGESSLLYDRLERFIHSTFSMVWHPNKNEWIKTDEKDFDKAKIPYPKKASGRKRKTNIVPLSPNRVNKDPEDTFKEDNTAPLPGSQVPTLPYSTKFKLKVPRKVRNRTDNLDQKLIQLEKHLLTIIETIQSLHNDSTVMKKSIEEIVARETIKNEAHPTISLNDLPIVNKHKNKDQVRLAMQKLKLK